MPGRRIRNIQTVVFDRQAKGQGLMASRDDRVEVSFASDENFVCGLLVTAASMAKYMPPAVTLSINVLDGGIHEDTFQSFAAKVRQIHEKTEFRRLPINEEVFAAYPRWAGSRMTYARLLLADLLPDVDHVIYTDVDYIWLTDVTELWKLRDDGVIFQSSLDGVPDTERKERVWCENNALPFDANRYFCAGLSFYNLILFRKENIVKKVSDFLDIHTDVPFVDQTAMNVLLGERVHLLPQKWQRFSRDVTSDDIETGCAIHFAGEGPWRKLGFWTNAITDTMLIWHKFNARLHGISTWRSLRRWYGAGEIVWRRALFHVASVPFLNNLFFAALRISGRETYVSYFKTWCRRLKNINRVVVQ